MTLIVDLGICTLRTVDSDGLDMGRGGASVQVHQHNYKLNVFDNDDGSYTFIYYIDTDERISVKISDIEMKGSPFVARQKVDPSMFELDCAPDGSYIGICTLPTVDLDGLYGGARVEGSFHVKSTKILIIGPGHLSDLAQINF